MASQPRFPFPAARSSATATAAAGGFQRQALDDLIRRELRISDPSDPAQVAKALRERYQGDRRAQAIDQEALGLPYLQALPAAPTVTAAPTSCDAEMAQARDDIERDLAALTQSNLLKDTAAELRGWGTAIRSLVTEGAASAPFALDTRQRDKVFGIRRQLGDYARIARLVGALTPSANASFRSLAKSLDEAANVLLVMMGDALANAGYTAGKFLLQVPFSELQVRREAVLAALRNLNGHTSAGYLQQPSSEFNYGLPAYLQLYRELDQRGHGDLRALLLEGELARMMDTLIERAAHGSVEGLRALGATAEVDLDRFKRLARAGREVMTSPGGTDPNKVLAPPLVAFIHALQLFVESFESSGGARLLRIARPPLLFYGLYGSGTSDAERRLLELIQTRGALAEKADCVLACACDQDAVRKQVLIDKVVYDLDRAIDLYALGEEDWGGAEQRAIAYGLVAQVVMWSICKVIPTEAQLKAKSFTPELDPLDLDLATCLWDVKETLLRDDLTPKGPDQSARQENSSRQIVFSFQKGGASAFVWGMLWLPGRDERDKQWGPWLVNNELKVDVGGIVSELCAQKHRDAALERLVSFMSGQCGDMKHIFGDVDRPGDLSDLVDSILAGLEAGPCEGDEVILPATAQEVVSRIEQRRTPGALARRT